MLLEVDGLSIAFRTGDGLTEAVRNLSFTVDAQEILCVVGESGSGKTLSQLAIMGLITDPNAVVSGSIRFEGRELLGQSPEQWRQLRGNRIAMIFQDPMTALTPVYSIGWQIAEQIRAHQNVSPRVAKARAIELLGEMGLPNPRRQAERFPHQLSGGMRQRAVIAMALSCNPSLLIADEPTTALDVTVQAQILDLLRGLRRDFGSAILFITHDMGVVATLADRVMVMYAGQIVERNTREALFAAPSHPYTIGLLNAIPPLHGPRLRRLNAIPGNPPLLTQRPTGCAFQPRCQNAHERCAQPPPLMPSGAGETACWLSAA